MEVRVRLLRRLAQAAQQAVAAAAVDAAVVVDAERPRRLYGMHVLRLCRQHPPEGAEAVVVVAEVDAADPRCCRPANIPFALLWMARHIHSRSL